MEGPKYKLENIISAVIYVYFIIGILWHFIPITKPIVILITPYGLFCLSVLIIYLECNKINTPTAYWLIIIFILTILFEIIGVKTKLIFGSYYYSNILGIKVFGVPFIIGINWMMIIYGLFTLVQNYFKVNIIAKSIILGLMAVLFDIILEPSAMKLKYWEWNTVSVPISNYVSWFIISFFFALAGFILKAKKGSSLISHYLFAQFLFLVIINILL